MISYVKYCYQLLLKMISDPDCSPINISFYFLFLFVNCFQLLINKSSTKNKYKIIKLMSFIVR